MAPWRSLIAVLILGSLTILLTSGAQWPPIGALRVLHLIEQPRNPASTTTPGVDAGWWPTVQARIRQQECHVTWRDETYLPDVVAAHREPVS
jgi:hypothetical protein